MGRWALCVLGWVAAASAQQRIPADEFRVAGADYTLPSAATLRVETRLVEVGAVVRDAKGHAVGGLKKDDFEVEDQGKKREITAFTAESGAAPRVATAPAVATAPQVAGAAKARPRFLALVFDDFSMAPGELMPVRAAAKRFAAEGLGPAGQAAVFFVSQGQVLPFTSDAAKIEQALDRLMVRGRDASMTACPYLNTYESFLIAEHIDPAVLSAKVQEATSCGMCRAGDRMCPVRVEGMAQSIWEQARDTSKRTLLFLSEVVKYMSQMPGERVVVMASSGFISRTLEQEREQMVDRALRANVVVHSLDAKGLFTQDLLTSAPSMSLSSQMLRMSMGTRPQMENNDSLAILAESTGGLFFHNNNDLALGFHELGLAPEASYTLGFAPEGAPDNRYHKLRVRLKEKGHYSVQARLGYFSETATEPKTAERAIDREVVSTETREDLPARVIQALPGTTAKRETAVHALVHLDTQHLPFTVTGRLRTLQLVIVAALFDERAAFVSGEEARATYMLSPETFQGLADGQNLGFMLPAGPGKYRLRVVVEEESGGKVAEMNRAVEIGK